MSAYYFSDSGEEAVRDYVDSIDQQLQIIRPYFDSQLEPITGVKLLGTRKRSPIDTPISFDADVPAVLRLLIDGVYQHDDVFVRELVVRRGFSDAIEGGSSSLDLGDDVVDGLGPHERLRVVVPV